MVHRGGVAGVEMLVCQSRVVVSGRSRNVRFRPGNLDLHVSVAEAEWGRARSGVQGRSDGLAPR
jgi:hypothetical protein